MTTFVIIVFVIGYLAIAFEHPLKLNKAAAALLTGVLCWTIYILSGVEKELAVEELLHHLGEISSILFFLLGAMTIVELIDSHDGFTLITDKIKTRSKAKLLWIIAIITFFLSALLDNLTTAIVMTSLTAKLLDEKNDRLWFTGMIIIAANAGGAFSPFGDITTLMVWQQNVLPFFAFFKLFIPSVVSFIIPAFVMSFAIPKGVPEKIVAITPLKRGASLSVFLFLLTIITAVFAHTFFHFPPAFGMMLGLAYLQIFSYFIKQKESFDIFKHIEHVEWDTLLFFYGVMLCIGALATLGYLELVSHYLYGSLGSTVTNVLLGALAAIIGNIPIMFSVLGMHPVMPEGQWLLITLTAGIGGNLLAIGSAAGVALMGESRGQYTFLSHLKWSWIILIGYLAAVAVHVLINYSMF